MSGQSLLLNYRSLLWQQNSVIVRLDYGNKLRIESQHWAVVELWVSYLTSLWISFFTCKMNGVIVQGHKKHPRSMLLVVINGYMENLLFSLSVVSDSLWSHGLYNPWNSPGQNGGLGILSLLHGIFPTQGSNPGLPHCRWILYQLRHKGSPIERLFAIAKLLQSCLTLCGSIDGNPPGSSVHGISQARILE